MRRELWKVKPGAGKGKTLDISMSSKKENEIQPQFFDPLIASPDQRTRQRLKVSGNKKHTFTERFGFGKAEGDKEHYQEEALRRKCSRETLNNSNTS